MDFDHTNDKVENLIKEINERIDLASTDLDGETTDLFIKSNQVENSKEGLNCLAEAAVRNSWDARTTYERFDDFCHHVYRGLSFPRTNKDIDQLAQIIIGKRI